MCGIFGMAIWDKTLFPPDLLKPTVNRLFRLSESRGKEASGLAVLNHQGIQVLKRPFSASRLVRTRDYNHFFDQATADGDGRSKALIGHARLVTNGSQETEDNNQPVVKDGLVGVHNGIIVNVDDLWKTHPELNRRYEVDTEVLLSLIRAHLKEKPSTEEAIQAAFEEIEGSASVGILGEDLRELILVSNTGSLFICPADQDKGLVFSSERHILETLLGSGQLSRFFPLSKISQVRAGLGLVLNLEQGQLNSFPVTLSRAQGPVPRSWGNIGPAPELPINWEPVEGLKRCARCLLPETMPFIRYDDQGVCNYCHEYQPMVVQGREALLRLVEPHRSQDGSPDCIVMFSGGRDSSYALHYVSRELGLHPIAFTYDWGVLTDLGRRNQARVLGKLGAEHALVSADITRKRRFVRQNLLAWLKKPELGMVPLLMAGDKQYYYYANELIKKARTPLIFVGECPLELSRFKAGFCGVNEGNRRIFNLSLGEKLSLLKYYLGRYLTNPGYLNASLVDTIFAFWSSYFLRHDYVFLYRYVRWDEKVMNDVLLNAYNWEIDPEASSTWRIGDGTAAFYNYIYYQVAGFTENETLRSNQIREGVMSRAEALEMVRRENRPRPESMRWYAETIGFDLKKALEVINAVPKLYKTARP